MPVKNLDDNIIARIDGLEHKVELLFNKYDHLKKEHDGTAALAKHAANGFIELSAALKYYSKAVEDTDKKVDKLNDAINSLEDKINGLNDKIIQVMSKYNKIVIAAFSGLIAIVVGLKIFAS